MHLLGKRGPKPIDAVEHYEALRKLREQEARIRILDMQVDQQRGKR